MATATISFEGQALALKNASALITKNGTVQIVAAVAGKRLAVFAFVMSAGGAATTLIFKSATTAISGSIPCNTVDITTLSGPQRNGQSLPLFVTAAGAALQATEPNLGTVQVAVWYVEVD